MRRRILLLVAAVTTLVVLAFAIPVALLVRSAVVQRSERSIVDRAQSIASVVGYGSPTTSAISNYRTSVDRMPADHHPAPPSYTMCRAAKWPSCPSTAKTAPT